MINIDIILQDSLTLFNKIISDLLPIIKEYYRIFPEFIIGPYLASNENYRSTERNDFENHYFMESFTNFYKQNGGFPTLEDFNGNVLFCLDGVLSFDYWSLRLSKEHNKSITVPITKGNIYSFVTFKNSKNKIMKQPEKIYITGISYYPDSDIVIKLFKYDN